MAFEEDFTQFFEKDDGFAEECLFTPAAGGAAVKFSGIFDAAYFGAEGAEVNVSGNQPRVQYESALFTAVFGDAVKVKGIEYRIVAIEPDGTGTTLLILEKPDES